MKRFAIVILSIILLTALIACSGNTDGGDSTTVTTKAPDTIPLGTSAITDAETEGRAPESELQPPLELEDVKTVTLDPSVKHQTIESFGASGAWWAQAIGGTPFREQFARLLFDPVKGIGLNSYRYNVGAGSADNNNNSPLITDPLRRAYSFETAPGEYDWTRDENAVWFMEAAAKYGVDEIVLFANSPLIRLTKNGNAYGDPSFNCNIAPSNYKAFATYMLDVAEHFKAEGLPIKFVSPINEPAFSWEGGQEGCHYSDEEVIAMLRVFVEEIGKRDGLEGVEISGPEGSSWRNSPNWWSEDDTLGLCVKIMRDSVLGKYFTRLDAHSYWTTTEAKEHFRDVFIKQYPNIKLRETEWCDMVGVADTGIEWGLSIANTIHEDMTILDCTSWSFWTAVSFSQYGDGLIYSNQDGTKIDTYKRFWALGNYSRYLDRGYTRIDCSSDADDEVKVSAYTGTNEYGENEAVIVFVNNGSKGVNFNFSGLDASAYNRISVNVTDSKHDLEETYYSEFKDGTAITIPKSSIVTVVISNRTEG